MKEVIPMEETKLTNTQTFFKSFVNNRILFERRKNSILYPIAILMLIVLLLALPSYFINNSVNGKDVMKNFHQIDVPLKEILTSGLDCEVKNGIFTCSEDTPSLIKVVGGEEKHDSTYTIIVNQKSLAIDTEVSYTASKDTDNLIILYSQIVRIRYIHRNHLTHDIDVYEIMGDYTTLEGFNLKEVSEKIANNPDSSSKEIENFILKIYRSTLDTQLFVDLASSIISFLLLTLITCIMLKGKLKRKKGFTLRECFKISMTSALPSIAACILLSFLLGISSASSLFGFLFVGRILFIYFKYIVNNNIFKELYAKTEDERFNF